MNNADRQAGETVNHYNLTAEALKDEPAFDGGNVLVDIKWKVAKLRNLYGFDEAMAEDLTQDFLLKVYETRAKYDPNKGASRRTFAREVVNGEACNAMRRLMTQRHVEGISLDEPIQGDKADSRPITFADNVADDSDLQPITYRGANQILTSCDLKSIRNLMRDNPVDWQIFITRWKFRTTDTELAEMLGWSRSKLRRHLERYEARYAKLLGVTRPNRH